MGSSIKDIYRKIKSLFYQKKNENRVVTFEESIQMGREHNFHGNNKVKDIKIGENSYVSYNSIIYHTEIGKYCSIGPNVVIGYGDHPIHMISTSPHIYLNNDLRDSDQIEATLKNHFKKVIIENDVWIGANVYIKNGVRIGNGAVIGTGAVVLNDVDDYEIVVGVPAKKMKMRFEKDVVSLLLQIKWWDLNRDKLKQFKNVLENPTVENLNFMKKNMNANE